MGFWVVVAMVRARAESSVLPRWKLLMSSVADIQIVCGWAEVDAKTRRWL